MREHAPTMLPLLASSLECLKAPEVQFMMYFIPPEREVQLKQLLC